MPLLKQSSTAQPLVFLLVQSSDHITGLTGASPTVTLSKAGGSFASPSGAVSEIGSGWYKVAGNATDTGTLGPLLLHATAASADPVDDRYDVVAFDPQLNFSGSAAAGSSGGLPTVDSNNAVKIQAGTGTGQLDFTGGVVKANLVQILATALTETAGQIAAAFKKFFNIASPASTMDHLTLIDTATTVTNQLTAAQIATGVWQDATSGDFTVNSSIGKSLYTSGNAPGAASGIALVGSAMGAAASVTGSVGSIGAGGINRAAFAADTGLQSIRSSTAQAGAASSITLDSGASATDNFYPPGTRVYITGGTGVGQIRGINNYVGSTKVASISPDWKTAPDNTSTFAILPVSSVWDELIVDHLNSGTTGLSLQNAASADPWGTTIPGAYGAGTAGNIVGNNLNAAITSRMATYTQPTGFLAATFPSGTVANTTNITAGTITTVTNLTNAPTSGDFTAAMKTSLNAATPTVTVGAMNNGVISASTFAAAAITSTVAPNLDAAVSSRSTYAGADTSGTTTLLSRIPTYPTNFSAMLIDGTGHMTPIGADGLTFLSIMELVVAFTASNKSTYVDNGDGTATLTLYKQDGTTVKETITFNKTTSARSASTIH